MVNQSFVEGKFPDILRGSKVIPIYKNGDRTISSNYRPIAHMSVLAKIFETKFKSRILKFTGANNILCQQQYGFRSASNTAVAVADFVGDLQKNMFRKLKCSSVFIDLKKAFDSVDICKYTC